MGGERTTTFSNVWAMKSPFKSVSFAFHDHALIVHGLHCYLGKQAIPWSFPVNPKDLRLLENLYDIIYYLYKPPVIHAGTAVFDAIHRFRFPLQFPNLCIDGVIELS